MGLTLSVLRCPDAVPPETRSVPGGEFSIGRGADNDWTLPDPDRTLSRRHCVIAFRAGSWQLADVSANGTYMNREAEPVGQGGPRALRDGDRLRMGAYEIEVRLVEEAWQGGGAASPDPFGDDPFAPARPQAGLERDPLLGRGEGFGTPGVKLPDDFDPLAPGRGSGFAAPFGGGATQPDHAPALEQAFRPPAPPASFDDWDLDLPGPAGASAPAKPAADDWDIDLSPAVTAASPPAGAVPVPGAMPVAAVPGAGAAEAASEDPFAEPERDAPVAVPEVAKPAAVAVPVQAPVPVREPAASSGGTDLMAAFLRGAGMADARPDDAEAAMERLGAAFRALVAGLRQTLIARAAIKGEFRIEQTMIRARGNNPLKFSAGDDDALAALLGAGRRTDMAPEAAVREALDDIRLHELASMAAMQSAVRALVARFDPAPLRAEGEKSGGLLGAQKRARSFELFEKLHGEIAAALADDFDSVFGKAFARAYEQALREVGGKDGA
jgi:type VI secretion system protein ImpI/type VI secretion system protein